MDDSISTATLEAQGLLTHDTAVQFLGTTRRYLRKMVHEGTITPVKLLSRNLYRLRDLQAYLKEHPDLGTRSGAGR